MIIENKTNPTQKRIADNIEALISEVRALRKELDEIKKTRTVSLSESLIRVWDNDHDNIWDKIKTA